MTKTLGKKHNVFMMFQVLEPVELNKQTMFDKKIKSNSLPYHHIQKKVKKLVLCDALALHS